MKKYGQKPQIINLFKSYSNTQLFIKLSKAPKRKQALALCKDSFDIESNVHLWIDYYKKITHHV